MTIKRLSIHLKVLRSYFQHKKFLRYRQIGQRADGGPDAGQVSDERSHGQRSRRPRGQTVRSCQPTLQLHGPAQDSHQKRTVKKKCFVLESET